MQYTLKLYHKLAAQGRGDGIVRLSVTAADDDAAVDHANTAFGKRIADSQYAVLVNAAGVTIRTWGSLLAQGS